MVINVCGLVELGFCAVLICEAIRFGGVSARTDPGELQAVYEIMEATGNGWARSIPDVCDANGRWHGIECSQDTDEEDVMHVVGLSFGVITEATAFPSCATSNSTIPAAVGRLIHLKKLGYFHCCTENPQGIPPEIGLLGGTLETLHLRNNGHVQEIPPELSNLTSLRILDLHGNSLNGSLPSWMHMLRQLRFVDMSWNEFEGELTMGTFLNLENLVVLDLTSNRLSGSIPNSIASLRGLEKLDLSFNNFSGGIPSAMGNLGNLVSLNLAHNALSGTLPESMGSLASLQSMDLQGNFFRAPIPWSFGNLSRLQGLMLSGSHLTGLIPSSLGALPKLRALFLDRNQLTGCIPMALGRLSHVYELGLSDNLLVGPIPFSESFVVRLGPRLRLQDNVDLCYIKDSSSTSSSVFSLKSLRTCRSNLLDPSSPAMKPSSSLSSRMMPLWIPGSGSLAMILFALMIF